VDGLPAGSAVDYERYWDSPVGIEDTYAPGVPLGTVDFGPNGANMQLNTHFRFTIEYHETPDHKYRVVGVSVDPESKQTKLDASGQPDGCYDANASPLVIDDIPQDFEAVYTYSVHWVPSDVKWATRWDRYMAYPRTEIHWFSLTNSAIICTALVAVVNAILVRAVRKDIARYNEIDLGAEDIPNQSGWKLVSGDVFRAPRYRMLLSVFLGTGAHLLAMVGVTLFFTLLGFLSPANRGPLLTATIVLCTLFASVGGYVSALAYKTFGGEEWRLNLILTPTLVPGIVFAVFLVLNFLLVFVNSSGAVPFGTMLVLVFMWFTISIPLSAGGGLLALRTDAISVPVKTNQIPRQIPDQRFALRPIGSILIGGLLPFVAIVIELYFIFDSLWSHRIYFMFGFLFVCVGLAILAATTVTIITVYLMLCSENHLWAWQSFFIAGSCAFYVLGYSLIMLLLSLFRTSFVSACLYIGYSFLVSFLVFVLVGSVGYVATFFFLRRIYATVKID
jgi:transmembrane 9 superfamily protein 2/4